MMNTYFKPQLRCIKSQQCEPGASYRHLPILPIILLRPHTILSRCQDAFRIKTLLNLLVQLHLRIIVEIVSPRNLIHAGNMRPILSPTAIRSVLDKSRDEPMRPTALIGIGGVAVIVVSRKMQAYDQALFRHVGVEPSAQKILALKSSVHFRADFQPIAEAVLVAAAPGPVVGDPATLPFRHLRPGLRLRPGDNRRVA